MQAKPLGVGKLPAELLHTLLERHSHRDERVVVGPRVGEDAAVLDMGERYLVVKSDPITFAVDEIGWYLVHVNANDIATTGATPRWLLVTLLLPEKRTEEAFVERIFAQCDEACRALGITLCGGHTEITHGLDRAIAVGLMLGEVEKEDLVCTAGAQVGDDLILTKGVAIEGTAILAKELGSGLAGRIDPDVVARAQRFLIDPGISVLRDAQVVCQVGRPHAMHDPTEGGLATALWEVAQASGHGMAVDLARVLIYPETEAFCVDLNLDPLGLIASGALLIVAAKEQSLAMVQALEGAGIPASVIGRVIAGPPTVLVESPSGQAPFPRFDRDELARVFET